MKQRTLLAAALVGLVLGGCASASGLVPHPARGLVELECRLPGGQLRDCRVIREQPVGQGFGAKAVRDAEAMQLTPRETAPGATIRFTMRVDRDEEPAAVPPEAPNP